MSFLDRLAAVDSRKDAEDFVGYTVGRVLSFVTPAVVKRPLPVPTVVGRVIVGMTAGAAALVDEVDLGLLPLGVLADAGALAVEAYVGASVRVRRLNAAGVDVSAENLAGELGRVFVGKEPSRLLRRWVIGLAPVLGAVYDAWDAQRTVVAMDALPVGEG